MTRIVSGIQPSGQLHLGNYLGAIRPHLELQHRHPGEALFFIADYHALTTLRDPDKLRTNIFEAAATYLALGLDPTKALLFRQSDVPEVTELAWLLATVTGMGLLERSPSYKDKIAQGITPSVGLFFYPLLMAADILAYGATSVPVGKDQLAHLELAQDVAIHWNTTYKKTLVLPEPQVFLPEVVPGIDGRKMSKSYGNEIPIFDWQRVSQIVTDGTPYGSPLPWDTCTVAKLLRHFASAEELLELEQCYRTGQQNSRTFGYGHAKKQLIAVLNQHFAAAVCRYQDLLQNQRDYVEDILRTSAVRAREIAKATLLACRSACGLA